MTANDVSSAIRRIAKFSGHLAIIAIAVVSGSFMGSACVHTILSILVISSAKEKKQKEWANDLNDSECQNEIF